MEGRHDSELRCVATQADVVLSGYLVNLTYRVALAQYNYRVIVC